MSENEAQQINYLNKSISELEFILINRSKYTEQQLLMAEAIIKEKRVEWREKNINIAEEIDNYIRSNTWFDFQVNSYDGYKLSIIGSTDLSYYHTLEIVFEDVFFYFGFLNNWHSDTGKIVFGIPQNEKELNRQYEIEQDYLLFEFNVEDYMNNILVAANNISCIKKLVKHYQI